MQAIFKREFASYFAHPIGYVFLTIMVGLSSLNFFLNVFLGGTTDMRPVTAALFGAIYLLIPLLTMRLFSEEKRRRTEQIFYTSPVTTPGVVFGKFFGALLMYSLPLMYTFLFQIILTFYTSVDWGLYISGILGLLLVGALLIAIGMFISSLTESQAVAAIAAIAVSMLIESLDKLTGTAKSPAVLNLAVWASPYVHFYAFFKGCITPADIFYFITFTGFFIWLTVRVMDKKRYV